MTKEEAKKMKKGDRFRILKQTHPSKLFNVGLIYSFHEYVNGYVVSKEFNVPLADSKAPSWARRLGFWPELVEKVEINGKTKE